VLEEAELERYERQIRIFGSSGQERLKRATAFIAGAGGLGSVVSVYLAAAGLGRMVVADGDVVDRSNLNRQILHQTSDLGRSKVLSAQETLQSLNPEVRVEVLSENIEQENVLDMVGDSDLIVDALDNFSARYLLNQAALAKDIPLFHGAVSGFGGQATTIIPGMTACLRCIFPRAPPKEVSPSLGATCGVIGSLQATEVLKYLLGEGELLENRLLIWDGLRASMDEIPIQKNPRCEDCGGVQAKFK
jgi:molybdopterin/thiamine biosynthesis adenylyltransferase